MDFNDNRQNIPGSVTCLDDVAARVLRSADVLKQQSKNSRALLYIRQIPCSATVDEVNFSGIIKSFTNENGYAECEIRFRDQNNSKNSIWVNTRMRLFKQNDISSVITAEFENITPRKSLESLRKKEALREALDAANKDRSTGVYNKYFTEDIIRDKLAEGDGGLNMLLILDIDFLKITNDTYGHPVGDLVIKKIAKIMNTYFHEGTVVGRIGGDEFMALVCGLEDENAARNTVEGLLNRIREVEVCDFKLSVSIGCVLAEFGKENFDSLYTKADKSLYHVKRNRKNDYDFYTSESN